MPLFWKKHTEPVPVMALPDENETSETQAAPMAAPTPTTTTAVPTAARMSQEELRQIEEQRRLTQTSLDAVQQQIDELADAVRRHNEYVSLAARHDEANADLYAKNKTLSAMRADEQQLERFEACEEALPLYLRLRMAEQLQSDFRQRMSAVKEQERTLRSAADNALNHLEAMRSTASEARNQMDMQEALETGYRIDGQRQAMDSERNATEELRKTYSDLRQRHAAMRDDMLQQRDEVQQRLADARAQFAPLNSNRELMETADTTLAALDNMYALRQQREAIDSETQRLAVRQRDMNDRLATLFQRDQRLEEKISTMQNEIAMHREQNHGIDGQALQLRVMNLRARRQELNTAIRLWAQICSLCESIETSRMAVRSLQQGIEKSTADIERMETNVRTLRAEAKQRRYDYTVSKGQNVIKLRGDLREGVACSVCGATTHPFHCDTMPEQNHLIAEWKSEADRLDIELRNAENALLSEQLDNATRKGTLATIVETLERQQATLHTLTAQWTEHEELDPSLRGINPTSMSTACTQTLRGLLEMTVRDETASSEQLNTYNYHQQQINRIAIDIDNAENERMELSAGLNETNTACQVMAAQAEWLRQQAERTDTSYQQLYQQLDKIIDLNDWHGKWLASHDNFKLQVKTRSAEWLRLLTSINEYEKQIKHIQEDIELCDGVIAEYDNILLALDRRTTALNEQERLIMNQYARLFASSTAHDTYRRAHENLTQAQQQLDTHLTATIKTIAEAEKMRGTTDAWVETVESISNTMSEARSALDDWLYNFRMAGNPPCRLDELQQLFDPSNDWNAQRSRIRQARNAYDLAKAIEEEVRTKLLSIEHGEEQQSANSRRETLLRQRLNLLNTLARLDHKLTIHRLSLNI